jgi:hypothetical protein
MRPLAAAIFCIASCTVLCTGCTGPKPFLLNGDAKSAEVGYAMDPSVTLSVARLHCAEYERLPRLLQAQDNIAYYECVRP